MTAVLFDTNIVVDYLSGRAEALAKLEHYFDSAISLITWMEVMTGVPPALRAQVQETISSAGLLVLPLNDSIAAQTVALRYEALHEEPKRHIKLPDAVIQAKSDVTGRLLVTRNISDFRGARIRMPYQVDALGNTVQITPRPK